MLHSDEQLGTLLLLTQRPEISFHAPRLPRPQRIYPRSSSIPEAIIACMVEAREPTRREIVAVAARIWKDWSGKAAAGWKDVVPGSPLYRKMIAAARFALGDSPRENTSFAVATTEPWIWWRTSPQRQES